MDHSQVAQPVEHSTVNRNVVGSSPTLGALTAPRAPGWNSSSRGRRVSNTLGSASEVEVFAAFRRAGYGVFLPFLAPDSPYDCVIDDGEHLLRVQVKTGYVRSRYDSVRFATRSTSYHRAGGTARTYHGVADLFAVWVPELARCYVVPVSECGRVESSLRLSPARSGQKKGIRIAADYELRVATPARVRERVPTWAVYSAEIRRGA